MSTWYKTYWNKIEPVEVGRSTDGFVHLADGQRRKRITSFESFFPSWEEAHAHLLAEAEYKLNAARRQLEVAQGTYGNIKGMTPSAEKRGAL